MKKCILINSPIFWDAAAEGENYLSPLGLGYIATYVEKAGIQVEILDAVKQRISGRSCRLFCRVRQIRTLTRICMRRSAR